MKNFKNKIVVITGAGSGMGKEYALEFARLGSKLALNDYNKESLEKLKQELTEMGIQNVLIDDFDVSDKSRMYAFADKVKNTFGNAQVVINNAGVEGATARFEDISDEQFDRVMNINFYGVLNGTRAFLPHFIEKNEGALVNVSSSFGLIGIPTQSDYCSSKFAVRGLTEALYVEYHNTPIQIHIVHPGGIKTSIAKKEQSQKFANTYLTTPPEKIVKKVIRAIQKDHFKTVYGRDSLRIWTAANILPKGIARRLLYKELKRNMEVF